MTDFVDEIQSLGACAAIDDLARGWGEPLGQADYRCSNADFKVSECGIVPSGDGEHLMLRVRKDGQNTRWVAKQIAEALELPYRSVSYAGLKDRHAVTEQWFSAHMPGQADPDPSKFDIEGTEVLHCARHNRKLRPGQLSYNAFVIVLRNVVGVKAEALASRLQKIAAEGVPNYFGPQRFGRDGNNLKLTNRPDGVRELNRERRAFALSAWRGALFNGYLAQRVAAGSWNQALTGDVLLSDRPRGIAEHDTSVFESMQLPAGLLWGKGVAAAREQAGDLEADWYGRFPVLSSALEAAGSRASRRVLRLRVGAFEYEQKSEVLKLSFALGPGSYATSVLREIYSLNNISQVTDK